MSADTIFFAPTFGPIEIYSPRPVGSIVFGPPEKCYPYATPRLWFVEIGGRLLVTMSESPDLALSDAETFGSPLATTPA